MVLTRRLSRMESPMQTRLELLHRWTTQLQQVLPAMRVTRVRVLALLSLGLIWAESASLPRIAAALPLPVQDLSTDRRLRRWLANRRVGVTPTWQRVLGALLARLGQRELLLVFDPTPCGQWQTVLMLGLVVHQRVLPLAWHVVPGQAQWTQSNTRYLTRLCRRVGAVVPTGTTVTLLVDRGLASADIVDVCHALGWHYVMRLSVDATQGVVVRHADGTIQPAWDLVGGPGQRWGGPVATFKAVGWRQANLTIVWPRRYEQPWLLLSDRDAGPARVAEYRRRAHVEASYQDWKTRGWDLEGSKLTDPNRLNRLLLALVLASWWCLLLGQQVIRTGQRHRFDRPNRRDLSVLRLGRRWMGWLLDHEHLPALPLRQQAGRWVCRWQY
jgi:DDE family transposase